MESGTVFSNEFLLEGFKQAPMAIVILGIPGYTVKMANPNYLQMVDRSEKDLLGQPLFDVIPEIRGVAEPLLNEVLASHKPYFGNEVQTLLNRHGKTQTTYFNIVYQPVRATDGTIDGIMVVANEVTELVKAKQSLQESEKKVRVMVFQSPIAMAILRGPDFVIELANDALLKNLWRREFHKVQGKKLQDVMPELEVQPFLKLLRKVFESGAYHSEKEKLVYFSAESCSYFDFEFSPLFFRDGTVSGILVTAYDVSEKVIARRKREENEDRLKLVLEASGLGTWELDLKSGELLYSDEYLACFGVSEPLSHEQLLEFIHPDDFSIRRFAFQEALSTGWLHYIVRLQWKDKSIHWIEANGKVIYDEAGDPYKIIGASRDLTEEKLYQKSIKESEQKFRLLADSLPQFIWISDASGSMTYFNQSVYDYTGMAFEQLKGQLWNKIVHPEDRVANIKKWFEAVNNGGTFLFEHRFLRSDGLYRWQLSRATPQYDARGKIQMWVGTSTDIHDQKTFAKELEEKVFERTRELKATNEVLEKTNRELEQFAYIASHDLQEPLRKIQTFADILKRNIHDEVSAKKYFSKIDSSAQRMGELIKSVLDYSRLPVNPGQLRLTDLNEVLENVKSDLELTISDKNAVIENTVLPAIPGVPLQLQQLFSNLIGNALKFSSDKPGIQVTSRAVNGMELADLFQADPAKQYVELLFKDNGIGFENRYKDQIFTIFQRLHGWQQYSGTGIGLALCKKIVENHQGFITAESQPGKGATFKVYLPA